MIQHWARFVDAAGMTGFGTLQDGRIALHTGDLFDQPEPTGRTVEAASVRLLMPTVPTKVIALWNNFGELRTKLDSGRAAPSRCTCSRRRTRSPIPAT